MLIPGTARSLPNAWSDPPSTSSVSAWDCTKGVRKLPAACLRRRLSSSTPCNQRAGR